MATIEDLKKKGIVSESDVKKLSAEQKKALESLSDDEIKTLEGIKARAGGMQPMGVGSASDTGVVVF